jgi:hypothetical protein
MHVSLSMNFAGSRSRISQKVDPLEIAIDRSIMFEAQQLQLVTRKFQSCIAKCVADSRILVQESDVPVRKWRRFM